jgi:hypothetical protein
MKNKKSSYKLVSFEEKGDKDEMKGMPKKQTGKADQENIMDKNKREAKKNDLEMNT